MRCFDTFDSMKRILICAAIVLSLTFLSRNASGQCSICTKTAQQMGEKPAKGLNAGILYLALTPFVIAGFIGYRWWKRNQQT